MVGSFIPLYDNIAEHANNALRMAATTLGFGILATLVSLLIFERSLDRK